MDVFCLQTGKNSARARVPEFDLVVFAPGHEEALGGMPFDAFDVPTVAGEDAFLARLLEGPYSHARVVAGGCETTVVWAEADSPDGLSGARALPGCEIVHVGLEILDDAALVCRGEVGAGMGEGEGADGGIVRLEDGLKVECEAVP